MFPTLRRPGVGKSTKMAAGEASSLPCRAQGTRVANVQMTAGSVRLGADILDAVWEGAVTHIENTNWVNGKRTGLWAPKREPSDCYLPGVSPQVEMMPRGAVQRDR